MATSHSLGKRSLLQPVHGVQQTSIQTATARRTVMNQGSEHDLDGLLEYLQSASLTRVDSFQLRQLATAADLRAQFTTLVEQWVDAKALVLFTAWTRQLPRKAGGERRIAPPPEADALPDDVHELDPFFRTRGESKAIRRGLTISQRKRWASYFERFGCHACGGKARHAGCGFCSTCYARVRKGIQAVEDDLRAGAAIGR